MSDSNSIGLGPTSVFSKEGFVVVCLGFLLCDLAQVKLNILEVTSYTKCRLNTSVVSELQEEEGMEADQHADL